MRKITRTLKVAVLVAACAAGLNATAQSGQPHSLAASVTFSNVGLQWSAPASQLSLKWHDGNDYNGLDGEQETPGGPAVIYAGNKFTAAELKDYVGEKVDSINYFQYRNVANVRIQVYENGKLVRDQEVDVTTGYVKNTWKHVALDNSYTIPANADVIFAIRLEHGTNQTFAAICDRSPQKGKGNIYSFDGQKWNSDGPGDFLITAVLHNSAVASPDGYNVYRDNAKVNDALVTDCSYELTGEADGQHSYKVGAVYGTDEKLSNAVTVTTLAAARQLAPASSFAGKASELSGTLSWQAPLQLTADNKLTWSNGKFNQGIGGTSSTAPKVWIKHEFTANDLLACQGAKITAINSYLVGAVKTATVFIMKNGVIDYSEAVADSVVSAIQDSTWVKYPLAKPYQLETGNTYAFGVYYTHAAKGHPIGTDSSDAVDGKGNAFSVTSASSTFANSKPTWKNLSAGSIAGNFMLSADVEGAQAADESVTGYDLYRDGSLIVSGTTATSYNDAVSEPGIYNYSLVTKYASKQAPALDAQLTYTQPAAYAAPTVVGYSFNDSTKQFDLSWSASATELKHYGTASYLVGFDEDINLIYGTKFQASELASYAGYQIKSIKFGIGEAIDSIRLEIINSKGERLYSEKVLGSEIEAGYLYSTKLAQPVTIPAGQDLYLVYNAALPGGKHVMILDGGPLVEGGAMVSLSNGSSWLKLGTVASSYANYNIVIAATAEAAGNAEAAPVVLQNGRCINPDAAQSLTIPVAQLRDAAKQGLGVDATSQGAAAKAPAHKASSVLKPVSYKVYRNNHVAVETTGNTYTEVVDRYGDYEYYVTAVYSNGWESPASKVISFTNAAPSRTQAPFALTGTYADGTLHLSWQNPESSQELSYQRGTKSLAIGMTGGATRESYCAIRFKADTVANFAGKKISHIKFTLADDTLSSASVYVMKGDGIVYEQTVALSDLKIGENVVRLNVPYEIPADRELSVGYHITYKLGRKPMVMDEGPSVIPGYSDLLSSSATDGYWYSMKTKFSYDYNWRISAVLAEADHSISKAPAKAAAVATTYNVYRDGVAIAQAVETTSYDVTNAQDGSYTVTAVVDGVESAESNAVVLSNTSGIDGINATSAKVEAIYGVNGMKLNSTDLDQLSSGVYLVRTADGKVKKVIK